MIIKPENCPDVHVSFENDMDKVPIDVKEHLICSPVSALRVIKQVRFLFVLMHTVILCHDVKLVKKTS